jgi:hypothetical protein
MNWFMLQFKWIMLISGILTSTMIYTAIAPQAVLNSTFGATLESSLAEIVVRNWGVLIIFIGLLLIYGAFVAKYRPFILVMAGVSKLVFIALVLTYGRAFLGHQAGFIIILDAVMVGLYLVYLLNSDSITKGAQ